MCGRFKQTSALAELAELLGVVHHDIAPAGLCVPGMALPVLTAAGIRPARWGFTPHWAKMDTGTDIINARSETLGEKPLFKTAFKQGRCLIAANGFYEWDKSRKPAVPHDIHFEKDAAFAFAGIWDHWENRSTGETLESMAIVTRPANALLASLHPRMPVIFQNVDDMKLWLSADAPLPLLHQLFNNDAANGLIAEAQPRPANDLTEQTAQLALF